MLCLNEAPVIKALCSPSISPQSIKGMNWVGDGCEEGKNWWVSVKG